MFNEKTKEWSAKQKKEIPVWKTPKYEQSVSKALEIIEKYEDITEADFWILMNETKTGNMAYTGLIISHNGCLKINDHLEERFRPECVALDKDGYKGSLVYSYMCAEQGIYEVGEVSDTNCKNAYPYAMAYKRLFDRVVLKLSKIAYAGIYSDSEADEFKEPVPEEKPKETPKTEKERAVAAYPPRDEMMKTIMQKWSAAKLTACFSVANIDELTDAQVMTMYNKATGNRGR